MNKFNLKDSQDHFEVLRKIQKTPYSSQRKIASELGFSLGKLNYCLKSLQKKGLIKVQNFKNKRRFMKIVVTIGTGNSGCGAIHDYLISSTKCKSPFKGQEFRMMDDPDGILNLYHNFYTNRSINNSSNSFSPGLRPIICISISPFDSCLFLTVLPYNSIIFIARS